MDSWGVPSGILTGVLKADEDQQSHRTTKKGPSAEMAHRGPGKGRG